MSKNIINESKNNILKLNAQLTAFNSRIMWYVLKENFFETPCLKPFIKSAEYYLVFEGCEFIFSICSVQIIFIFIILLFHTTGTKPCSVYLYSSLRNKLDFKGTVNVISSDPQCKDDNTRFLLKPFFGQLWKILLFLF